MHASCASNNASTSPIRNGSNLLSITEIIGPYSYSRLSRTRSRCSCERTWSPHNPSPSIIHLMRRRNLSIIFCSSIVVLSSVQIILAFACVCFWKYSWICSQSWYEWTHPIVGDKTEAKRVDWSHNKRFWSCCSQSKYAGFAFSASQYAYVRKRIRI